MRLELPDDLITAAEAVMHAAGHVTIDHAALGRWADALAREPLDAPPEDPALILPGSPEQCANFVLLASALNFCFWSDAPWEVDYADRTWTRTPAMVAGLRRAVDSDAAWLTATRWSQATPADVADLFHGRGVIPQIERRLAVIRETGEVLAERCGGSFITMVRAAEARADRLAVLLAETFPSFHDVAEYRGRQVPFLKRAQICTADLHRLWLANNYPGLSGLDRLTVFADYRLPQLFRHTGAMTVSTELAERIARHELIPAGSAEEIEIRAATVLIGQRLAGELGRRGRIVAAWELDYPLWWRARQSDVSVLHHRTVTCFY